MLTASEVKAASDATIEKRLDNVMNKIRDWITKYGSEGNMSFSLNMSDLCMYTDFLIVAQKLQELGYGVKIVNNKMVISWF